MAKYFTFIYVTTVLTTCVARPIIVILYLGSWSCQYCIDFFICEYKQNRKHLVMMLWNLYLSVLSTVLMLSLHLIATVLIFTKTKWYENNNQRINMTKLKKCFLKKYWIVCWIRYFTGSVNTVGMFTDPSGMLKILSWKWSIWFICRHCLLICKLYFYTRNPRPWSCLSPRDPHPWISVRWRWRSTDPIFPLGCGRTRTYRELPSHRWR